MDPTDKEVNIVGPFAGYIAASYSLFQHNPLDLSRQTVRLVCVLPDLTRRGRIQCRLWHSKTSAEEYRCVSYMWGASTDMYVVNVNGKGFAVRENLWRFLDAARQDLSGQALWIDALCINQETVEERNHQVQQMGTIYMNAKLTVTWISGMNNIFRLLQDDALVGNAWCVHSALGQTQDGLTLLCNNEYWRRVWVIQEILLAKELVLMTESCLLAWTKFSQFLLGHSTSKVKVSVMDLEKDVQQQIEDSWPAKLAQMRMMSSGQMHEHSLFDLLRSFGKSQCSDIRDRVLGLLGLACDFGPETFQLVDYSKDVVRLFELVMKFCTSNANVLSDARVLIQGSNLTREQLMQVVKALPGVGVRTSSLRKAAELGGDYLECEHCEASLVFKSLRDSATSALPTSWLESNHDTNEAARRYTISGAPLNTGHIRKGFSICCLADYGFNVHLVFGDGHLSAHNSLERMFRNLQEGVLLPRHDRHSCYSLSIMREAKFSLCQSVKGGASVIHGDFLAKCFLLFGIPSEAPFIKRYLLHTDDDEQNDKASGQTPRTTALQRISSIDEPLDQGSQHDDYGDMLVQSNGQGDAEAWRFSQDLRLVEDFVCMDFFNSHEGVEHYS